MITAALLAVLAALCNAAASVLQRRAALTVPQGPGAQTGLILALVRKPVWLWGITALIGGFLFQAAALSQGAVALVQPVMVVELPFTMVILSVAFGIVLDRHTWLAIGALSAGLAIFLIAAAPDVGRWLPDAFGWIVATAVTAAVVAALVAVGVLARGALRPAALGVAAGIGFAFTATLIKRVTAIAQEDLGALPRSWQLYAMVAAGLCSLFLLQHALHSGPLVIAQPALTISDPIAGILYGGLLFGEPIRSGSWIVFEAIGIGSMAYGVIQLARSPLIQAQNAPLR
ncbi:DMT family transporter [Nonomuraea sp. LP-02]|uniref:DMT family transporter n=1 Tax=Nonomuraea sp. LP-02 TaxID=3097960 RepID=UPI002E2EDF55|nr:DMT family transporter [Nonomuraea sp. LP-02]MED7928410.1 DMT family transporter [Nonomuraea sp. LP-02]